MLAAWFDGAGTVSERRAGHVATGGGLVSIGLSAAVLIAGAGLCWDRALVVPVVLLVAAIVLLLLTRSWPHL